MRTVVISLDVLTFVGIILDYGLFTIIKYFTCNEIHFMISITDFVTALFELPNISHKN